MIWNLTHEIGKGKYSNDNVSNIAVLSKKNNLRKFESFQEGFLGNSKPEIGRAIITINLNIVIQNSKNQNRNMPINLLEKPGTNHLDAAH